MYVLWQHWPSAEIAGENVIHYWHQSIALVGYILKVSKERSKYILDTFYLPAYIIIGWR